MFRYNWHIIVLKEEDSKGSLTFLKKKIIFVYILLYKKGFLNLYCETTCDIPECTIEST